MMLGKVFAVVFAFVVFASACAFTGFTGTVYVLEHTRNDNRR